MLGLSNEKVGSRFSVLLLVLMGNAVGKAFDFTKRLCRSAGSAKRSKDVSSMPP